MPSVREGIINRYGPLHLQTALRKIDLYVTETESFQRCILVFQQAALKEAREGTKKSDE